MSWNVGLNSILPPDGARQESFARILKAIDPDVIALQEVMWPDLAALVTQLMNGYIPLVDGGSWHVHKLSDNVLISRFPMHWQGGELSVPRPLPEFGMPNFHLGFAAALLELPESAGSSSLLIVNLHNKSGAHDEDIYMRQVHADSIVRWLRDLRDPKQANSVADNTPIVILGDMNAVPNASMAPLETLLTGDIADEETFGPDFSIDWDATEITDARPSHNAVNRDYYTWRNDNLPFPPSALDRVLYTDSVMSVRQRFVLNTTTLPAELLTDLGLEYADVLFDGDPGHYDHLPLVVDFELGTVPSE